MYRLQAVQQTQAVVLPLAEAAERLPLLLQGRIVAIIAPELLVLVQMLLSVHRQEDAIAVIWGGLAVLQLLLRALPAHVPMSRVVLRAN